MFKHKFITQEDHKKAIDALDIQMPEEVPSISEDINDINKSTMNYVIAQDKEELMELLENLKKRSYWEGEYQSCSQAGEIDRASTVPGRRIPFITNKIL